MQSNNRLQQLESYVFSSELGQKFTNHPLLIKDVWSLKELGFSEESIALGTYKNTNFKGFSLPWLKYLSKLTILVFSTETKSINSLVARVNILKNLDEFLVRKGYSYPELITSNVLNKFVNEGKNKHRKNNVINYATSLWREEGWLDIDYIRVRTKKPEPKVKTIPENILLKFYKNLELFPEPLERLLRLQIAWGFRTREMLLIPRQCLKQEGDKWYLRKRIAKRDKKEFIKIHPQAAEIVRAQQKFLDDYFGDLFEFNYLFCKIYVPGRKGKKRFQSKVTYHPEILSQENVHNWIVAFRKEANLVDSSGKEFPLTSHMLRRTLATTMANCEVPDVIIATVLGHASLDMLPHYRKIDIEKPINANDKTKSYVNKDQKVTKHKPENTRHEKLARLLTNPIPTQLGECHRPSMLGDCAKRSGCFKCEHYRMTVEDKPHLEADIRKAEESLAVASKSGQTRNINDLTKLIQIMKDWLKGIEKIEVEEGE